MTSDSSLTLLVLATKDVSGVSEFAWNCLMTIPSPGPWQFHPTHLHLVVCLVKWRSGIMGRLVTIHMLGCFLAVSTASSLHLLHFSIYLLLPRSFSFTLLTGMVLARMRICGMLLLPVFLDIKWPQGCCRMCLLHALHISIPMQGSCVTTKLFKWGV